MRIRPAHANDRTFVLDQAERLSAFGEVRGRDRAQMAARDRAVLSSVLDAPSEVSGIFVAEEDDGERLGFIHLTTADDYYTGAPTAHVADIVVTRAAEGRGVARGLLEYAEDWGQQRGFALLTLNVFAANDRARGVYARLGFDEEWIRCVKRLKR